MGPYTDMIAQNAEYSLADALRDAEDDFRQDFIEYWGLESPAPPDGVELDEWRDLRKLYGLAKQVAGVAATLVRQKGLGPQRLAEPAAIAEEARAFQARVDNVLGLVREQLGPGAWSKAYWNLLPQVPTDPRTRHGVFQNSLEFETSSLFLPQLDVVVGRLQALLKYIVATGNDRTRAYLARVARCYCLDHRPELAVMCRAVLDTALQDIAPDEAVRAKLGGKPSERVGLSKRLEFVDANDLIQGPSREAMARLKKAGDDAVHVAPGLEPEPEVLIGDLVSALTAIGLVGGASS